MWGIENPAKVFAYITETTNNFANLILLREKYDSFPENERMTLEKLCDDNFSIFDIRIKNPDNPAQLLDAKLLMIRRNYE
jgi:hypothetical protein